MTYSHHITPIHLAPMCQIALRCTASQSAISNEV